MKFGPGILPEDVTISRDGASNNLVMTLPDSTTVTITDQFQLIGGLGVYEFNRIEQFTFTDSETVWTAEDIMQRLIDESTTTGSDEIYGFFREDVLEGGLGDDLMDGGHEGDIYIYNLGDGNDTISDYSAGLSFGGRGNIDELQLVGIDPEDITVERSGNSPDLVIRITSTNETITLKDQANIFSNGDGFSLIEKIIFDDTTEWTPADLRAAYLANAATSGNDHIYGFYSAGDTLDGGAGNDTLQGLEGGDTYLFGIGSGNDTIIESGWVSSPDTIIFGAGVTPGDVLVSRVGDDLLLEIDGTSDTLTIEDYFYGGLSAFGKVEYFQFADTTVWDDTDIADFIVSTTNGNDTVTGSAYDDLMYGKQGNDLLNGTNGSDTYLYYAGDGNDTINEDVDYSGVDTDTLMFGPGIDPEDLIMTRTSYGVTISFDGMSGSIAIPDQFYVNQGIEQIIFDNDTIWDVEDIKDQTLLDAGTSGNDTINGFSSRADTLNGHGGNDYLAGGTGLDTYIFELGGGNDVIDETYADTGDTLLLGTGFNPEDVILTRDGSHVTMGFAGLTETIQLKWQFYGGGDYGVEYINFNNTEIWDAQDIRNVYLEQVATSGADTITGFNDSGDVIQGKGGNDLLSGLQGADTYIFNLGDGNDTIDDGPNQVGDTLFFGAGLDAEDVIFTRNGSHLTIGFDGLSESVELKWQFYYSDNYGVEHINFNNTMTWDAADIRNNYLESLATTGNDSIQGFDTFGDIVVGGLGNDTLDGLSGNDVLIGGAGADTLYGSSGVDTFTYAALTDSTNSATDVISDFVHGTDKIDVRGLGFTALDNSATPSSGHLGVYTSGSDTYITDGSNFKIKLVGTVTVTDSDMIYA